MRQDTGDDSLFLSNQLAGSLEGGNLKGAEGDRAVINDVFLAVEVEENDLALPIGNVRINQYQTGKLGGYRADAAGCITFLGRGTDLSFLSVCRCK